MVKAQLPEFAENLFKPYRYKVLYGGRGSGKSYSVARAMLLRGKAKRRKILCAREFQNSISDSVHSLLKDQAEIMGLMDFYTFTRDHIMGNNGTEFLFKGVRHNIQSIKSIPGITDLWLEEAQTVSQNSWDVLIPTVRDPGSEIFVTYNPENEDDPTHRKFVMQVPPENSFVRKVNWNENPWFPEVLEIERLHAYETNPDLAEHIWGGECRSHSDAQVFKGKFIVDLFEPKKEWAGPYMGADWGFSVDPTVLTCLYIDTKDRVLYVRHEAYGKQIELEHIAVLFDQIKLARTTRIRADCSRPETISFISRRGFMIEAAKKWAGSVEDGVEFIKSFWKVVIHPECKETAKEFKNYSYKVDRLTQDVTTEIIDAHNHCIDSIRYGLQPMISKGASILDVL